MKEMRKFPFNNFWTEKERIELGIKYVKLIKNKRIFSSQRFFKYFFKLHKSYNLVDNQYPAFYARCVFLFH